MMGKCASCGKDYNGHLCGDCKLRVLFLDSVHPHLQQELEALGYACDVELEWNREEIERQIDKYIGIVQRSRIRLDRPLLEKAVNLRFIARSGSGMENIDTNYAQSRGILCINAPEGNRNAVGEHALGMLLALFNKLPRGDREVRQGLWNREDMRGLELEGKVVGIIGYGNTGSSFAHKLKGFDVRILAYDKYKSGFGKGQVSECSMEELCSEADIVSLHVPLTNETKYMVDKHFVQGFIKPFYLINTSRGQVVNTVDLVQGLREGKVLGACLDVLEYEHHSLEMLEAGDMTETFRYLAASERVLLSPHVAGWTEQSYRKLSATLAEKIAAAASDGRLSHP